MYVDETFIDRSWSATMLSNAPLAQPYRVVQRFGDNPAEHRKLLINGVPLLGHEGMDLAAPPGTQVAGRAGRQRCCGRRRTTRATARWCCSGTSGGSRSMPNLGSLRCRRAQRTRVGRALGCRRPVHRPERHPTHTCTLGCASGRLPSTTAGWATATRRRTWTGSRRDAAPCLGPHIIGGVHPHLDLLRRWQPRLITVLDPNPDEMALLRAACPQAVIVGRIFVPDSDVETRITSQSRSSSTMGP